jgi:hypothetical protein
MAISKIGSKALVDCSVAAVDIEDNSITSAKLAGSIANAKLANSSITVNGTSVSLGASGSLQPVSWQSVVVSDGSTVTTMVAGNGYFVNNTSAAGLVKLPISASAGDTVAIKDYAGNFGTNSLTIQRNGHNIQGIANDSLISTNRASLTLVYVDATKGWLYAVESNVDNLENAGYISATGGTVTTSGDYKIHTFTGDGCFVVSCVGFPSPSGLDKVDYLVVAGGGGGGAPGCAGYETGGGGAGGYRESKDSTLSSPHTASPLAATTGITVTTTTYPVTVAAGGSAGATDGSNYPGSNSVFSTITSAGGGGGGSGANAPNPANDGDPGGSGGGGNFEGTPTSGGTGNTPPVSPPQGNPGGTGGPSDGNRGGGGGGAGQNGRPHNGDPLAGAGGLGVTSSINGTSTGRAGGGDAGGRTNTQSGPFGGGPGAGSSNTGSGGAGTSSAPPGSGSNGGSGIVIIRYKFQ